MMYIFLIVNARLANILHLKYEPNAIASVFQDLSNANWLTIYGYSNI